MIGNTKYYPSPSAVTYFINGLFIDDVFRVDFERKVTHQPVWGFDSQQYDFIARGKEIVSGNIIVNFRYPGYLRAAIKRNKSALPDVATSLSNQNKTYIQTLDPLTLSDKMKSLGHAMAKKKAIAAGYRSVRGYQEPTEFSPASASTVMIDSLKQELMKRYGSMPQEERGNPMYDSILDDKAITPFDLTVRYGPHGVSGGFVRVFKDCIIIGEGQTVSANAGVGGDFSSSAQPILEIYPFFAKTIQITRNT